MEIIEILKRRKEFESKLREFISESIKIVESNKNLHSLFIILDVNTGQIYASNYFKQPFSVESCLKSLDVGSYVEVVGAFYITDSFRNVARNFDERSITIKEVDENFIYSLFDVDFFKIEVKDYPLQTSETKNNHR